MKLWHWKSHWKSRVTLKILGTKKKKSNSEIFSVWFKIFQCDYSVSEQHRKIFQCDYVVSFVNIFQCDFCVFFNVKKKKNQCHSFIVTVQDWQTQQIKYLWSSLNQSNTHTSTVTMAGKSSYSTFTFLAARRAISGLVATMAPWIWPTEYTWKIKIERKVTYMCDAIKQNESLFVTKESAPTHFTWLDQM